MKLHHGGSPNKKQWKGVSTFKELEDTPAELTPGKIIAVGENGNLVQADPSQASESFKVKAGADDLPGYLNQKLEGGTGIEVIYAGGLEGHRLQVKNTLTKFTDLEDTPGNLTPGKIIIVGENGSLTQADPSQASESFKLKLGPGDPEPDYLGEKLISGDGIQFSLAGTPQNILRISNSIKKFTDLQDTPANLQAGKMLVVNSQADGIAFQDVPSGGGAVPGGSGGTWLPLNWWKQVSNIGSNTPFYDGAYDGGEHPLDSTRSGTGMNTGGNLCPVVSPCNGAIRAFCISIASACTIHWESILGNFAYAHIGLFRNGFTGRTLLGRAVIQIPKAKVGINSNLAVNGMITGTADSLNIPVSAGDFLGAELLHPQQSGSNAVSTIDSVSYPWQDPQGNPVLFRNACGGFLNVALRIQII